MNYKLPTRSDDDYTRFEKFEKYEYTHQFTYELARRNSNVENLLNLLSDLFAYCHKHKIIQLFTKYEKTTNITDEMWSIINDIKNNCKEFFIGLVKHYNRKEFINSFEDLTFDKIKENLSYFVNILTKELYDKYYIIYLYESEEFTNEFHDIYNSSVYLERDKVLTEHIENTYANETSLKDYYKFNSDENEYFTVFQDIHKEQQEFSFNTIYPNFRTAMRDFTDTKIVLNLNLSKSEIIDYIEKIKDDYDNKNSIIKTPRQLLKDELEIYDYVVDIDDNETWADILFIYDYYRICKISTNKKVYEIKSEIQMELIKYHGLKIQKTQEEIKNKKDTKYKITSWNEYIKNNPETNESNIFFDKDTKPYLSTKAIAYKYTIIKKFIEGKNPKYKILINRHSL